MSWYGIGKIGNMMENFLNPGDAFNGAESQLEQGWGAAKKFLEPYQQAGIDQIGTLQGAQKSLLNPIDLQSQWAQAYQTSPFAKILMDRARESGLSGASSMGLMGSSAALNNVEQSASDITAADRDKFLADLMEKFKTGLGIGQNLYSGGIQAGGALGQQRYGLGEDLARAEYGKDAASSQLVSQLIAAGLKLFGGGAGGAGAGMAM